MLSPRLEKVASLVPKGTKIADVGTDHAYLPIYLMETGIAKSTVATDIHKGPIDAANANIAAAGVKGIKTILCDGLNAVAPNEVDTVIIAGMGGDTIAHILSEAAWLKSSDKLLILQPMSSADSARIYLAQNGYKVEKEVCVEDAGRVYPVMTARFCGRCREISFLESQIGIADQNPTDAEYKYLLSVYTSLSKKAESINGIERLEDEFQKTLEAAKKLERILGEKYAL